MTNRVHVSLGSNINKEENLPAAVRLLRTLCNVVAVSSVYETCPVGLEDQPRFLNAAARVDTALDAAQFRHQVLALIEQKLRRVRLADKNAPRTIDADMTLFNDDVFDLDPEHHIPDPDLLRFPHVVVPIAELAPDLLHPETGEPLSKIAERLLEMEKALGQTSIWERPDIELSPGG